jgi:hypothetical protein
MLAKMDHRYADAGSTRGIEKREIEDWSFGSLEGTQKRCHRWKTTEFGVLLIATIRGIAMTTYRVSKLQFGGQPGIGLLDVEGSQTSFSETDKEEISHFFGLPPYPKIIIESYFYQDSNQRSHGPPDYVNAEGTKFWAFRFNVS